MGKNKFNKHFHYKCKSSSRPSPARLSHWMLSPLTPSKMLRPRSRTKKAFLQISKDSSSLESSSRMAEPSPITTSRRSQPSILCSDSEEGCRSSLRLSLVRPSPSMSSQQTQLRTSKPRSKTRKESPQISKDSFLLVSNLRTAELSLTTTFKRSPLSISS